MIQPVILFDGVCNLCNAAVRWVIARDPDARFRFASLQSDAAREALGKLGGPETGTPPESIFLIDEEGVHTRSAAVLRIARGLGRPYSLLRVGSVLPRPMRDGIYDLIACNRYRWFGRSIECPRPTASVAARFLDADVDNYGVKPGD